MKIPRAIKHWLITGFLLMSSLIAAPQAAKADVDSVIETMATILDYASLNGYNTSIPVTGQDVRDLKGLFVCLDNANNDLDVTQCVQDAKNTETGKKVLAEEEIPSWVENLFDFYVAVRDNDFWGAVAALGEAAICAVAQFLAGGVDVCGIIKALIETAEKVLDTAKACLDFLEDAGEIIVAGLEKACCGLSLGCDCGGSGPPPKPTDQVIYEGYFAPRVPEGLVAIEDVNPNSFNKLREDIKNAAITEFKKIAAQVYTKEAFPGAVQQYSNDAEAASKVFFGVVNAQWSADIAQNALPALGKKRGEFQSEIEFGLLAWGAAQAYEASPQTWDENGPGAFIKDTCTSTFRNSFKFAHVDRWISIHKADADNLKAKSNQIWCSEDFWKNNQAKFGERFRYYLSQGTGWCPGTGQTLVCDSAAHYKECRVLMGSVGQKDQCGFNVATAGVEAAKEIDKYFKDHGSKIPCQFGVVDFSKSGIANKPVDFICERPTQEQACNEYYQAHFGTLPVKVVNCSLAEKPDYIALKNQVKKAVLNLNHDNNYGLQTDVTIDPLLVGAPDKATLDAVKNQNFGFGPPSSKSGFDTSYFLSQAGIDGLSTPMITAGIDLGKLIKGNFKMMTPESMAKEKIGAGGKPGVDPVNQLSFEKRDIATLQKMDAAKPLGVETVDQLSLDKKSVVGQQMKDAGKQLSGEQFGAQTQTKVMSGTLPPGSGPGSKSGPPVVGTTPPAPLPPPAAALPDITSTDQVKFGNLSVAWGGTLTVDASQAVSRNKNNSGLCEFAIEYSVRNIGQSVTGGFRSLWTNNAISGNWTRVWAPMAAGSVKSERDLVPLKPGNNVLQLALDDLNQVQESNERNNTFSVTVNVTGNCGATIEIVPPAGSKVPPVQQPQRRK